MSWHCTKPDKVTGKATVTLPTITDANVTAAPPLDLECSGTFIPAPAPNFTASLEVRCTATQDGKRWTLRVIMTATPATKTYPAANNGATPDHPLNNDSVGVIYTESGTCITSFQDKTFVAKPTSTGTAKLEVAGNKLTFTIDKAEVEAQKLVSENKATGTMLVSATGSLTVDGL